MKRAPFRLATFMMPPVKAATSPQALRLLTLTTFGLTLLIQLSLWTTLPHDSFWGPDPGAKLIQALNLSFFDHSIAYPGQPLDPTYRFTPFDSVFFFAHEGKLYGIYNPLFSAVSGVLFRLGGYQGLYVVPILSYIGLLVLTTHLIALFAPRWQPLGPPLVGLGSPLLFYSLTFWEHTLGVFLALASVLLVIRGVEREANGWLLLLAGVASGLGFAFRTELGLWALTVLISALLVWRHHLPWWRIAFAFSLGVLGIAALFQLYEWLEFGALVKRHIANNYSYHHLATDPVGFWRERTALLRAMLFPAVNQATWIYLWLGAFLLGALARAWRPAGRAPLLVGVALLLSAGMAALLFRNALEAQGFDDLIQTLPLLALLPVCVVAPRAPLDGSAQRGFAFLAWTVVLFTVLVVLTTFNAGGTAWGPRYLLATAPLLIVLTLTWFHHIQFGQLPAVTASLVRLLLVGLLLLSGVVQYRSVQELRQQTEMQAAMVQLVADQAERVVVVDWHLTSQVLAPIFYDKLIFGVTHQEEVEPFVQLLQQQQIGEFIYVSLILNRDETFTPPLDFLSACDACLVSTHQTSLHFERNYTQMPLNVHYTVYGYALRPVGR